MQLVRLAVSVELEVAVGEGGQGWSDERRGVEVSLAHENAVDEQFFFEQFFLDTLEGGAPATHRAHAQSRTSAGRSLVDH